MRWITAGKLTQFISEVIVTFEDLYEVKKHSEMNWQLGVDFLNKIGFFLLRDVKMLKMCVWQWAALGLRNMSEPDSF